jgi:uncharacterized protein (DUF4415 family)
MPKTRLVTVVIDEDICEKMEYIRKHKGITRQFQMNSILREALIVGGNRKQKHMVSDQL